MLDFTRPLQNLSDHVYLRMESKYLESFFNEIKWNDLLSDATDLMKTFAHTFFVNLTKTANKRE